MNHNYYVIDSSSLMQLNRSNPIDVFLTVWKKLEGLVNNGTLLAPKEVFYEIQEGDDQLTQWTKKQKKMFIEPTPKQIEIVKDILSKYPAIVKEDRKYDADPWIIALAVELSKSSQTTLFPVKRIVVTEERLRGSQIKIPFVCQKYNIEAINIVDMFRLEGWKF